MMNMSVRDVRRALPAQSRERSTLLGLLLFTVTLFAYGLMITAALLAHSWSVRCVMALVAGLAIGMLFVVGHDACHGSLTPKSTLNRWVGRVAFLPSLHPYASWEYSHNALHHGWTNLRGKDPVYCPMTLEEFRALSPLRRRIERLHRSWAGLLPLYLTRIWWTLEISPSPRHREHIDKRGTFQFDRALVAAFAVCQLALIVLVRLGSGDPWWSVAMSVFVVGFAPFLTFAWLMAFATFQHHTHPRTLWYDHEREWNFFRAQVQGTVHVEFPRWIELMLNNIMEHTAHHVDPKVPLYRLTNAQDALEATFGEENVIRERFSFAGMSTTLATCQLYDYDEHRWLSFDGVPTTPSRRLVAEARA